MPSTDSALTLGPTSSQGTSPSAPGVSLTWSITAASESKLSNSERSTSSPASSRDPRATASCRASERSFVLTFSRVELRWAMGTRAAGGSVLRAPFDPSPAVCPPRVAPARWPSSVCRLPSEVSLDPSEEQPKSSGNRETMTAITAIITGVRNVPRLCSATSGNSIIDAQHESGSYPPPTVRSPVKQAPRGARGSQAKTLRGPRYADSAPTFPPGGPVLVFSCDPDHHLSRVGRPGLREGPEALAPRAILGTQVYVLSRIGDARCPLQKW